VPNNDGHTIFRKNFLSDVVFRMDYPLILDLEETIPKDFQKNIYALFPILEIQSLKGLEIKEDGTKSSIINKEKKVWKFFTKSRDFEVELDSDHLAVNAKKYTNFDDFLEKINLILDAFYSIYANTVSNRLGLRYINQIVLAEDSYFDWSRYLKSSLIGNIDFVEDKSKLRRIFQVIEIYPKEDVFLSFKSGIFNSTFPAEISRKEFILDYDCYTRLNLEKDNIIPTLQDFSNIIFDCFRDTIKPEFEELLNE